ncbi:MAG: ABC transporter ATP-binding protein [Deinococcus sp.]|nr:ABC transporter ATP-binding protein [Deinococcus sp.]
MDAVVNARGLVKYYGGLAAVAGIDFHIAPGEFFGMLGPNGAGKTTTMRLVYRVTPLSAGELSVLGYRAGRDDRLIKAGLGVVPQLDNLDEELTVLDNLLVYARYNELEPRLARRRAEELLAFLELTGKARSRIRELSGGMKRRLTLARGLMSQPKILVLDEPTTGLDPQVRLTLWDKLGELRAQGVTLFMSTHYMDEAERLCDRLVIMDQGRIVVEGTPRDLVRAHVSPEVIETRLDGYSFGQVEAAARCLGARVQRAGDRVSLFVKDGREALRALETLGIVLHGAYLRPGNLEDVFLKLTGRTLRE